MELKNQLTDLRKNANLTQAQLAAKINYSDKVISKWERGESLPDIQALCAIAKFYNISIDELIKNAEIAKLAPKEGTASLKGYEIHFLLFHVLLLLCAFTFYLAQFSVYYFFRSYMGTRFKLDVFTIIIYVFMGLLFFISLMDMVFVYLKINRKATLYTLFSLTVLLFVFIWIAMYAYGLGGLFVKYAVCQGVLVFASVIYGYFVAAKVINKD